MESDFFVICTPICTPDVFLIPPHHLNLTDRLLKTHRLEPLPTSLHFVQAKAVKAQ
ncbi:hypothetical protein DA89_3405 [Vibrio cholerae]|nr:hypothetical protein DN42_3272 [Vibrio cholerae]KFE21898.1 hypothetical protein DA89_3405 [Vibrio cholerae]